MGDSKNASDNGADKIGPIKDLFEHPYFQLAIEKEVRSRTNAYLKVVVSILTVALAIIGSVAGYQASSLLGDARRSYEGQTKELEEQTKELKNADEKLKEKLELLNRDVLTVEGNAVEAARKSNEAEVKSGALINQMSQEASQAKAAGEQAQAALAAAQTAQGQAQQALSRSQVANTNAEDAAKAMGDLAKAAKGDAAVVEADRQALDPLMDTNTRMLFSTEERRVMAQGHGVKNPCVDLENAIYWDDKEKKFKPYGESSQYGANLSPNRHGVRFRIRHIHFQPLKLTVQIFADCTSLGESSEYLYTLKDKFDYTTWHPLPSTPFSFRLADVFYPKLSFTFIHVEMRPDERLLKCQARNPEITDEGLCPDLKDTTRQIQVLH
jgi:type II secretory pathway pseudopilin PulG